MKVLVACRRLGKAGVVVSDEPRQEGVRRVDRADVGKSQLLYQAILERMMSTLDAALRLAGIGTENLDVELGCPSELGHSIAAGRVLVRYPKDRMLVGVEGNRLTVMMKIGLQRFEI